MNNAVASRKLSLVWINRLCRLALGFAFALAFGTGAGASTITLKWDPVTASDLAGYRVYYSTIATPPFTGLGAVQGSSPVDVATQTTATITGLDPGVPAYFAITAYNSAGAESPYSAIVAVPELIPPTVSLTSPATNAAASGTVSVSASAADNVGVTSVEFYVNGVLQATDTATPYLYSWNTAALPSGPYTLTAKAYDAAGNVGTSADVSVTVVNDVTPPTVTLVTPANGATVSGIPAVTANASDNVAVTKVEFYLDGALLSAGNVPPYSYSWDTSAVANGPHTLSAKAYDAAGNVGLSAGSAVTVCNDTVAPVITAFSMPSGASGLTVAVSSFTATDNTGVTGFLITESSTPPAAGAAGWSATAPTSFTFGGYGSRSAYAWAKDAAGNVSAGRLSTVAITQPDTTAPAVTILSPSAGSTVGSYVTISASATDNVAVTKMGIYVDNILKTTSKSSSISWSWYAGGFSKGAHVIKVNAYDAANNVGSKSITVYR
jgi:chitinase